LRALGEAGVAEEELRRAGDRGVVGGGEEAALEAGDDRVVGVELEDAPLLRAAALALHQQALELRAVVVLGADQAGRRGGQPGRQAYLLDVVVEERLHPREQRLELLLARLERLLLL